MLPDFNAQDVANTIHAVATARHVATALYDAMADEAVMRGLRDFNPQDFANMAWAFATAGHASPALYDAMARTRR